MEDSKYISLLSDYGFKVAFGDETDTLFLRKALQAVINSPDEIKIVKFLRNEVSGLTREGRGCVYDIFCEDEKGQYFIIEMQLSYYKNYMHRAKFYAFQRLNTLALKGKYKFDGLTPIYCIGFLANNIFPNSKEYYHYGQLMNQVGEVLDDQIKHVIVEISKFDKKPTEITSDLEKLIYLMKNAEHLQDFKEPIHFLNEKWIDETIKKLQTSNMTPEERMAYEYTLARNGSIIAMQEDKDRELVEKTTIKVKKETTIKVERETTIKVKKEEAIKTATLLKEEVIKVKKEEAIKTATSLKEKGMPNSFIIDITGLPLAVIEKIGS